MIATTLAEAVREFRDKFSQIQWSNEPKNEITYNFEDRVYIAKLKGRNRDLLLGYGPDADKAVAARTFLDGHANLV